MALINKFILQKILSFILIFVASAANLNPNYSSDEYNFLMEDEDLEKQLFYQSVRLQ